jgi:hypothetical protein
MSVIIDVVEKNFFRGAVPNLFVSHDVDGRVIHISIGGKNQERQDTNLD